MTALPAHLAEIESRLEAAGVIDVTNTTIVRLEVHPDPPDEPVMRIVAFATPEEIAVWANAAIDLRTLLDEYRKQATQLQASSRSEVENARALAEASARAHAAEAMTAALEGSQLLAELALLADEWAPAGHAPTTDGDRAVVACGLHLRRLIAASLVAERADAEPKPDDTGTGPVS